MGFGITPLFRDAAHAACTENTMICSTSGCNEFPRHLFYSLYSNYFEDSLKILYGR